MLCRSPSPMASATNTCDMLGGGGETTPLLYIGDFVFVFQIILSSYHRQTHFDVDGENLK